MTSVFEYSDFREYLKDYYEGKKKTNSHFSYQSLSLKAGFRNREFLFCIMKGTKRISMARSLKLSEAIGLTAKEQEYFVNMVGATQAENDGEREYYLMHMLQIRSEMLSATQQRRVNQYEFYSTWYHSVIHSSIGLHPFRDDFEELGQRLTPPISGAQAKGSVQLLERLGLVAKDKAGTYRITEASIKAGPEISDICKKRYHQEFMKLAKMAIGDNYPERCNVTSLTVGVSSTTYACIMEETVKFKKRIIELANKDGSADRVYQYQLVSFPLTKEIS